MHAPLPAQVVAGTNYALVMEASLPCQGGGVQAATLEAQVFVPLPYTNSPPQVTQVQSLD